MPMPVDGDTTGDSCAGASSGCAARTRRSSHSAASDGRGSDDSRLAPLAAPDAIASVSETAPAPGATERRGRKRDARLRVIPGSGVQNRGLCDGRSDDGVRIARDRDGAAVIGSGSGPAFSADSRERHPRASIRVRSVQVAPILRSVRASLPPSSASGRRPPAPHRPAISRRQIVVSRQHRSVSRFDGRDLVRAGAR